MIKNILSGLIVMAGISSADINVSKEIHFGWNLISFPISSSVHVENLFSDEADGSLLWKYEQTSGWQLAELSCNNGCVASNKYTNSFNSFEELHPMDGFWIKSLQDYNLTFTSTPPTLDLSSYPNSNLTMEQKYALAYMWHEEKLAYEIYLELNKVQPLQQFEKLANTSEIVHIGLVEDLVQKYDINITNLQDYTFSYSKEELENMGVGQFAIEPIQNLYNVLYEKGIKSTQDALEVGCMVEVTDVNDLDEYIAISVATQDIVDTFTILRDGSYSHYWAFDKGLKNMGVANGCCVVGTEYCKTIDEYPKNN